MFVRIITLISCLWLYSVQFSLADSLPEEKKIINNEMVKLYKNYEDVMSGKKSDLIEQVFSENFIKNSGGLKKLKEKIQELNKVKSLSNDRHYEMTWKAGVGQKNVIFMRLKPIEKLIANKHSESTIEFVIIKEKGKLKIESTIGDSN